MNEHSVRTAIKFNLVALYAAKYDNENAIGKLVDKPPNYATQLRSKLFRTEKPEVHAVGAYSYLKGRLEACDTALWECDRLIDRLFGPGASGAEEWQPHAVRDWYDILISDTIAQHCEAVMAKEAST